MSRRSELRQARQTAKAHRVIARNQEIVDDQRRRDARAEVGAVRAANNYRKTVLDAGVKRAENKLERAQRGRSKSRVIKRELDLRAAQAAQAKEEKLGRSALGRAVSKWKRWL